MFEQDDRPEALSDEYLDTLSKEELVLKLKKMQKYTTSLEEREKKNLMELTKLKNIILMNYVSAKELESSSQFQETSTNSANNIASNPESKKSASTSFVDPSINSMIIQLRKELEEARKKRDELQLELNATKFTPESQLTKRLMAKCRKLLSENEELGRIISSGNVAQLEHDLAYHKQLLNEACENEQNINSFLFEIDNEMENMQAILIKLKEGKKAEENNSHKESSEKKSKKKKL